MSDLTLPIKAQDLADSAPAKVRKPKFSPSQRSKSRRNQVRKGRPHAGVGHIPDAPRGALAPYDPIRDPLRSHDEFMIANRDPDREYRWVTRKILDQGGGFDRRGWIPITKDNHKGETVVSPFGDHYSGTDFRNGDCVLAFMPKEKIAIKRAMLARRRAMFEASINKLKKNFNKSKDSDDRVVTHFELNIQRPGRVEDHTGGAHGEPE